MPKYILIVLAISTISSTVVASININELPNYNQIFPVGEGLVFLIAFMGWRPGPLDISVWHSIWTIEKNKEYKLTKKESIFDFNVGYITTVFLGICLIFLGIC